MTNVMVPNALVIASDRSILIIWDILGRLDYQHNKWAYLLKLIRLNNAAFCMTFAFKSEKK